MALLQGALKDKLATVLADGKGVGQSQPNAQGPAAAASHAAEGANRPLQQQGEQPPGGSEKDMGRKKQEKEAEDMARQFVRVEGTHLAIRDGHPFLFVGANCPSLMVRHCCAPAARAAPPAACRGASGRPPAARAPATS